MTFNSLNSFLNINLKKEMLRGTYFSTYQKIKQSENLDPLEKKLARIIQNHPEYHHYLDSPEKYQTHDFSPEQHETNPFLHLSLHAALLEQVLANRPKGITAIYKDLIEVLGDSHHAEHHIMEILGEVLHDITHPSLQNTLTPLSCQSFEKTYLKQLKKLLRSGCTHSHSS